MSPAALPRGKNPRYALNRGLVGPESRSTHFAEKRSMLRVQRIAQRRTLVTIQTELSHLMNTMDTH